MSRDLSRRDVLRAGAVVVASGIAGCFEEARNPGQDDTPSPTPEAKPMQPIDAANAGVFASVWPIEQRIHELINEARQSRGTDPLSWDGNLAYVSRDHSRDMSQRDFYSHQNPDGQTASGRMREYGLDGYLFSVSENIASRPLRDSTDSPDVVAEKFFEMWKNSDGHWRNIRGDYDRHGVGLYIAEDRWMYATSMFAIVEGRPGLRG